MRWQRAVFRGVALFGLNIETMRINPVPLQRSLRSQGSNPMAYKSETVAVQPAASSTSTPERTSWALNEFVSGGARTKWARMGSPFSRPGLGAGLLPGEGLR